MSQHNPNNKECAKNKCGTYVNCNNYECDGEHGQVSCTCPVAEEKHEHDFQNLHPTGKTMCIECGELPPTQPTSDWGDAVKPIITEDIDRAFDSFSTSNGYWQYGEMKDVGVVADRIIKKIAPHIDILIAQAKEMGRMEAYEDAAEAHSRRWVDGMEEAQLKGINATITLFEEWANRNLNTPIEHDALLAFAEKMKANTPSYD